MKKLFFSLIASSLLVLGASAQSFFTPVSYRGAFDATTDWTAGWSNYDAQNTTYAATTAVLQDSVTSDMTLTANKVWLLKGFVYVKNGATLTIEAGTLIRGDQSTKGSLIICRGAKINAVGTASKPIVFTSNQDPGSRGAGDWGGVILLGKAPINPTGGEAAIEGGVDNAAGDGKYGGTNPNDNSGIMQYVRIEFPGVAFQPNNEINGLTFGGVGNGTTIDHIQVTFSGDDSYEWFGGTVNIKYLIAYRGLDDDFDTDFGFSGKGQFCVGLRDSAIADVSGSNGFESDNDGQSSMNSPYTSAIFCNMTIVGPKADLTNPINSNFKRGAHIRRNTRESVYNSIIMGWPKGVLIDGKTTLANLLADSLQFQNDIIAGCPIVADTASTLTTYPNFDVLGWFNTSSYGNSSYTNTSDVMLKDPFNYNAPDWRFKSGSPAATGASFANSRLGGVTAVNQPTVASFISLFPNPANDQLNVEIDMTTPDPIRIEVLDLQGKTIQTLYQGQASLGTSFIAMNTSALSNGFYLVKISGTKGTYGISKIEILR